MRIVHLVDGNNACAHWRAKMPSDYLRLKGHNSVLAVCSGRLSEEDMARAKLIIDHSDVVCFHRFNEWGSLNRYCQKRGIVTIYFTDDYWILGKENPLHETYVTFKVDKMVKRSARLADAIIVSTPALREAFLPINRKTYCVPNMLDYGLPQWNGKISNIKHQIANWRRGYKRVAIGYYGSVHHYHDLMLVKKAIERLMTEFPFVEFHYGTANKSGRVRTLDKKNKKLGSTVIDHNPLYDQYMSISENMPKERVKFLEWKDIDSYGKTYLDFDIAIAPLTNGIMNNYKSNLKILEAGAYYLPMVCSPVRPFRETITHGVEGYLAQTEDEWYKYLRALIVNKELRKSMGALLGKSVRDKFDIQKHWVQWEGVLEEIVGEGRLNYELH